MIGRCLICTLVPNSGPNSGPNPGPNWLFFIYIEKKPIQFSAIFSIQVGY